MRNSGRPPSADERLDPKRRLAIGALALVTGVLGFAAGRTALRPEGHASQPIAFNHQKHVKDVGLECSVCHEYFSTSAHSGLPSLALCKGCHAEPLSKSAEEQKLIVMREPLPSFQKLFRLPDHARYSHRRHVGSAKLACETCHGAIAGTTRPPASPLVRITMATCTGCHAERGVKTDCTSCHR
jgi:hypothetical protein